MSKISIWNAFRADKIDYIRLSKINLNKSYFVRLDKLDKGNVGRIKSFHNKKIENRLLSIGIKPQTMIKVIRKAPFGGAIYIEVNEHFYALRREEAEVIEILKS